MKAVSSLAAVLLLSLFLSSPAATAAEPAPSDLGQVNFPNSGSPAAQEPFLRGVAALHSFWYDEAADAFREAQQADPGFALAYWGEAMTYDHPIWSEQDLGAARKALGRLAATPEERAAKAPTPREKGFLEAAEVLFGEGEVKDRVRGYTEAMRRLHDRFPDDTEVASFYALSLVGPALIGMVEPEQRVGTLMRAAAILEEHFDRNPRHPGVLHYLIHAYDDPEHAPLGLRAARIYAEVAPAAHHALHMPSHIFVQLGDWERTAASNEEAWAASEAWVDRRKLSPDKRDFHSLSWLSYAYLQQGRWSKVLELLGLARRAAREGGGPRVAAAAREMEARYLMETWSWSHVALRNLEAEKAASGSKADRSGHGPGHSCGTPASRTASLYNEGERALLLATGLGAARAAIAEEPNWAKDLQVAREAAAKLLEAAGSGEGSGDKAARVMEKEVSAMALLVEQKPEEALKLLAEAADLESTLPPPSGPPDPIKPAAELYGEILLQQGKPAEALRQFERALLRTPNRTASLLGAARASVKAGQADSARRYYTRLADIWRHADPELPPLREVQAYFSGTAAR
ncbi:MAG TPA: tetratricopeptide repeat protein [Thermoanaerobaculia bacterium]|nr:tetratricopeptide repeat protein [Thermoanaerobaculia bacterium]